MWHTTIKTLAAKWRRLLLTGAAIVLGIAFVTGSLVLTDTSSQAFDQQFSAATEGVDLTVRAAVAFGAAMGVEVEREPLDEALVAQVLDTPGVVAAAGKAAGQALLVVDGEAVVPKGPSMGLSWTPAPFNPFVLREGRAPAADGEVVVDAATAASRSIGVGERVEVQTRQGPAPFTVVGLAAFGDRDGVPNATTALFAHGVAQRLFEREGHVTEIQVVTDGPVAPVRERLVARLGDGVAITTAQDTAAASADAAKEQLRYIETMLLLLAATALLVGAFLIANTFAIVVAQRTRELAMLRAVGATGRQVMGSVLGEAGLVGLLASVIGIGAGVAAAAGLRGLLGASGVDLPPGPMVVTGRTLVVGLAVGVAVTLVSVLAPARRAARVAPVTAMRGAVAAAIGANRRRLGIGGALLLLGVGALALGAAARALATVGVSTVLVLAGVAVLAPVMVGPAVRFVGRPLSRLGVAGRLARGSAEGAPRRTAATATALAIGLAVVTFMTVVATSVKSSVREAYQEVVTADVVVESARGEMLGGLPPVVRHHVAGLPEVAVASAVRVGHWLDQGMTSALHAVDPATVRSVVDLDVLAGELSGLASGGVALAEKDALAHDVQVGDELPMTLPLTGEQRLPVVAIFADAGAAGLGTGYVISLDTYGRHFGEDVDAAVFVRLADGVDTERGLAAVREAVAEFPTVAVRDQVEAREARTAAIDGVLALVTGLLLLAVLVALFGIANTLGLSIVERTREMGLLRVVGMTRRQVSRMVRLEATLVAVIGSLAGVVLGMVFGWAAVVALSPQGLALTVPVGQLAAYLIVAALGGAAAGMLPARRAARLHVLAAVAPE